MSRVATFVICLTVVMVAVVEHATPTWRYEMVGRSSPPNHVAVVGDSYTAGTDEGGLGAKCWTALTWQTLSHQGVQVVADVAAEGRVGYAVPGDHGSVFVDLTARAVKPDDVLVVFFGSRNDQGVDAGLLAEMARNAFDLARRITPAARLLVIGPPWPTADVPESVLQVRDILNATAHGAGAAFVDPIADRWFVDRPDLIGPDGVHPNDAGHAYLADKIAPIIGAQLPRRR
ncbi:Rv0518 family GDSL lipase [Mycobacterium xenopi]|uniref:Rv0518 family GDSL lipase n=1 Tax=Mycobacterium xenopi TaxID=1789 RepID=UPI0022EB7444|nr:GDSL lipase [Mycobacterium xenopi]MDA3641794.1 SGNH/GDSL hydrolase family protein [Mycobacterium xenopi]